MEKPSDLRPLQLQKWQKRIFFASWFGIIIGGWLCRANRELVFSMVFTIIGLNLAVKAVGWYSRATDPRHAKRPPDAP